MTKPSNGGTDGVFGTLTRKGIRFESASRNADEYSRLLEIADRLPPDVCESIEVIVDDDAHFEIWLTEPLPRWACEVLGGMINAIVLGICGSHNGIGIYGHIHEPPYNLRPQ